MALTLGGALLLGWLLRLASGDGLRAGLAASLIIAGFFGFDRAAGAINRTLGYLSTFWVHHDYQVHPLIVLAVVSAIVGPAVYAVFRRLRDPARWTAHANLFALVLVALPLSTAVVSKIKEPARPVISSRDGVATAPNPPRRPDIYYIILDGYARSDVMKDLFGFDNGPFLDRLEAKGFFVARKSTSNYVATTLSLCSSLNFAYLQSMIDPSTRGTLPLNELVKDNLVMKSLRPLGYKFVAFSTGYEPTECNEADVFLFQRHGTQIFHRMLLEMTPIQYLLDEVESKDVYAYSRERTLFILDRLPSVTEIEGPTFTFAHILSPHPPYVFGENGEDVSPRIEGVPSIGGSKYAHDFISPEKYREGYRRQAIYLTRRIEETIARILAASPEPPIILLQSDHGSGLRHHADDLEKTDLRERMGNLSCIYFPDRRYDGLTERSTPVNSFRVVLNHFFGADLPLLEDRNYFCRYAEPLEFTDVTERLLREQEHPGQYQPPDFYPGMVQ